MTRPPVRFVRGGVYWATLPGGTGHDQGTRPVLVLSQGLGAPSPRALVAPISSIPPIYGFPLSWVTPFRWGLERPSFVLVDHLRSVPTERLRDPVVVATRDELGEVLDALGELLGAAISPR